MELSYFTPKGVHIQIACKDKLGYSKDDVLFNAYQHLKEGTMMNLTATQVDQLIETYIPKEAYLGVNNPLLAPLKPAPQQPEQVPKKGNTMYCDECDCEICNAEMLKPEIRYLQDRVSSEASNHNRAINKAFFIYDEEAPETPQELIDRIKAGNFVVEAEYLNKPTWIGTFYQYFKWRNPSNPANNDGARAARKVLEKATQTLRDTIVVSNPTDGLAALNAYIAQDFTKTTA